MTSITLHNTPNVNFRFSVVEYIKKLRNAGASQELAEVQAQEIEYVIEQTRQENKQETKQILENKDLATKGDLVLVRGDLRELELRLQKEIEIVRREIEVVRKEVAQSSTKLIIWMTSTFGGFSIFFLSVLAKGFHWI